VVAALTIASDILVGGLMVAVLGGMIWKRATAFGALASIIAGTAVTLGTMLVMGDIFANLPIYLGLAASLVAFIVCSLVGAPTSMTVLREWSARVGGPASGEST
jgi:SSS family solute:Na+ symporter